MLMYGFNTNIFDVLEEMLTDFLRKEDLKIKEFLLPDVVDVYVKKGLVKVIDTSCKWIGMTYKEDLSPVALIEFNKNSNLNAGQSANHISTYNKELGICGPTWVGTPFVYSYMYSNGAESNIQGFKLGWRKA